jgi:hypothetical protein
VIVIYLYSPFACVSSCQLAIRVSRLRTESACVAALGRDCVSCWEIFGDDAAATVSAIETLWAVVSLTCPFSVGKQSARYSSVTFCYHCSGTKTCPFSVVALGTLSQGTGNVVVHGEAVI